MVQQLIAEHPDAVLAKLRNRWKRERRRQRHSEQGFRQRLQVRWGVPMEKLRMLLTVASEFGAAINSDLRNAAEGESKCLIDVLTRLHARACQITCEVECLLSGGFSDGAMARWRSLHEVAVVALFISKHGAQCAERYIHHEIVESRKGAKNYERFQGRLGYEPIALSELEDVERQYQLVLKRYGRDFREQYGWARPYLEVSENARVNFSDIEAAVDVDHMRVHYQMASHNVHANPKGVFFKLGIVGESNVLLAGASNAGLADPGHSSAISLNQVSSTLAVLDPSLDNIIVMQIMVKLADEIGSGFLEASENLEQDHAKVVD
jgi:hypothetical protein